MIAWIKTSRQIAVAIFGFLVAAPGAIGFWVEMHTKPIQPSMVYLFVGIFGLGMLIIAPSLLGNAVTQGIALFREVRQGGDRKTDPPLDQKP